MSNQIIAETPAIRGTAILDNQHATGALNKGSWCAGCHKLLWGDASCDNSRCKERSYLYDAFAEYTESRNDSFNTFTDREVDERMKRLHEEIMNAKYSLVDSKTNHRIQVDSKRMLALQNLKT